MPNRENLTITSYIGVSTRQGTTILPLFSPLVLNKLYTILRLDSQHSGQDSELALPRRIKPLPVYQVNYFFLT